MAVTSQLLATKLFIPPGRPQLVSRGRLLEMVEQGLELKLTLICAPPGFGKTTLVAEWHQAHPEEPLAWISLDEADNEPLRFLRYLVAAFLNFAPDECNAILTRLDSPQPVVIEAVLTSFINALTSLIAEQGLRRLVLVLDDYHLIQNEVIHNALTFLLDRMPPQLHLIITSRADPLLPLARLRARNQLLEIRAAELRFQLDEAATFVRQDPKLRETLASEDIAELTARTEGWAAGLQLALLWLRGRENRAEALKTFSGNNRFVLEYLAEEVLVRQTEPVRTFLLQTSLLDRFNASLASAITELNWNEEDLAGLEQANLFLVPLDDHGEWYRYHHLFAEFLQHRLKRVAPGQLSELHLRASRWFERNNLFHEAIEHALAAEDFHQAARLIEPIAWPLILRNEYLILDGWLAKIPETAMYDYPRLCLYTSHIFLLKGQIAGYEKLLEAAQYGLQSAEAQDTQVALLVFQTYFARQQNNLAATIQYAEQALALISPDDLNLRMLITLAQAQIYLNQGEVTIALRFINNFLSQPQQKENVLGWQLANFTLADLYLLQGQLQLALETYQQTLKLDPQFPRFLIITHLRIGNIHLEWDEIELAENYLKKAEELLKQFNQTFVPVGYLIYAGLWWPDGDNHPTLDWSSATNQQIEQYWRDSFQAQLEALKARFGRKIDPKISQFEQWCTTTFPGGYTALPRPLEYLREPHYLTLARVLIYQHKFEEALSLLEELKQLAQTQGRTHHLIKLQILFALNYHTSNAGDNSQVKLAVLSLREALTLAEPGGYMLVFLEEGENIQDLLLQLLPFLTEEDRKLALYTRKLLKAFGVEQIEEETSLNNHSVAVTVTDNTTLTTNGNHSLIEPLSDRELEVLRLIASGASNQEIAERLVVTLSTVKKHITNIFGKLGVTNRTQVLLRARELDLI